MRCVAANVPASPAHSCLSGCAQQKLGAHVSDSTYSANDDDGGDAAGGDEAGGGDDGDGGASLRHATSTSAIAMCFAMLTSRAYIDHETDGRCKLGA